MKNAVFIIALALFTSCGGPEVWIPQGSAHAAVTREHVQFSGVTAAKTLPRNWNYYAGKWQIRNRGRSGQSHAERALIQKYGKPNVETQKTDKDVFRKSVWQSAKAQIKLGYLFNATHQRV